MSRAMAVHARYNFLYISLPSSAKKTTWNDQLYVVWRTWTTTANLLKFYFKFIALSQIQFRDSFDNDKHGKWLQGRDTQCDKSLQHVAATGCCNKSSRVTCENHCRCDLSHKFKLVWICATYRSDKRLATCHSSSADEATCRRDLLHRVSRP